MSRILYVARPLLKGSQLFGHLPACGIGEPKDELEVFDLKATRAQCADDNAELLQSLREDVNAEALHQITLDDHAKGRMTKPVPAESLDCSQVCRYQRRIL